MMAVLLALVPAPQTQRFEPFVPVGVRYDGLDRASAIVLQDLQAIRALGFSHVEVPAPWASVEPQPGKFAFERLDQVLALAGESGLKVIVRPDPADAPPWVEAQRTDLRLSGVVAFVNAVTTHAAAQPSTYVPDSRTQAFHVAIAPASSAAAPRVWRLDAIRSAAAEQGWFAELELAPGITAADVRRWGWTAIAHGARGVTFLSWYPDGTREGLVERNGAITDRARAAGAFAGIISRNAALFAPLRPRPSRVAIVYNPFWPALNVAIEAIALHAMLQSYQRTFEANLQADFISAQQIADGSVAMYPASLVPFAALLPRPVAAAIATSAEAGDRWLAGARTALPTARGLEPDIRIENGGGAMQARFLESPDAIALLTVNHGDAPRTATFHFAPETPEAIWQNMESGASVSFVQSAGGLTYTHAFAPRETMVLAIRKRLR